MDRRLDRLERTLGDDDDCGPLAIIAPNSWSDADRDLWERAGILHDDASRGDLIEKYTGRKSRPCRAPRPHITVVIVPAPGAIEHADEATRAAWRQARSPWRNDG